MSVMPDMGSVFNHALSQQCLFWIIRVYGRHMQAFVTIRLHGYMYAKTINNGGKTDETANKLY